MPKLKTKSGAKKRFKATKSGRIKIRQAQRAHILTKKSTKRKRQLRAKAALKVCDVPAVVRMLQGS
jgi:large subunit ribosomal protein L35